MTENWDDEKIQKALKGNIPEALDPAVSERVWASIKASLAKGEKEVPGSMGFPWGAGLRLAAAGLLLVLGLVSTLEVRSHRREAKIAAFMESVTEPVEEAPVLEPGIKVSALLTEPLQGDGSYGPSDEDDDDPTSEERGSLL